MLFIEVLIDDRFGGNVNGKVPMPFTVSPKSRNVHEAVALLSGLVTMSAVRK